MHDLWHKQRYNLRISHVCTNFCMVRGIIHFQLVLKTSKGDIERIHSHPQLIKILKRYLLISHKKLNINNYSLGWILFI